MNQVEYDEIDLFELFGALWDSKWLISAFMLFAATCGIGYFFTKDVEYESRLIYTHDTLPPFYAADKASSDFREMFYSESVFEDWKEEYKDTSITFDDFSLTKIVDGFEISKDEDDKLMAIVGSTYMLLRTKQLPVSDDFFNYANHVNHMLKSKYILRAKDELKIIEARFMSLPTTSDAILQNFLLIDRYVAAAEEGAQVLTVKHPTMPKKVSPGLVVIVVISSMLGGVLGAFFVLIRNAIRKRKQQVTKV